MPSHKAMLVRARPRRRAVLELSAAVFLAGTLACSPSANDDLSVLRVFYTSDAVGYLEPCG